MLSALFVVAAIRTVYGLSYLNLPSYFVAEYYRDGDYLPRQMQAVKYNDVQMVYVAASDGVHALIDSNDDGFIDASEDHLIWNDFTARTNPAFGIQVSSVAFPEDGSALYVTLWHITKRCLPSSPYTDIHGQIFSIQSIECESWFQQTDYTSHAWHYTQIDPATGSLCMSFGNQGNMPSTNYPDDWPQDVPQRTISCFNDMENPSTSGTRRTHI